MYNFTICELFQWGVDIGEGEEAWCSPFSIDDSADFIGYIDMFFKNKYHSFYNPKSQRKLCLTNNCMYILSKSGYINYLLTEIKKDDDIIYSCTFNEDDYENNGLKPSLLAVNIISDEVKKYFEKENNSFNNYDKYYEKDIEENSKYEIVLADVYSGDNFDSNDIVTYNSLDDLKKKILKEANYDRERIKCPSISDIDNNSFDDASLSYTEYFFKRKVKIKKITRICEHIPIFGEPNKEASGCIYSSGSCTNGIKHCSDQMRRWFEEFNKDLENIDKIALENWNFID